MRKKIMKQVILGALFSATVLTSAAQEVDFSDVKTFSSIVNSGFEDSKPMISGDGKTLYFVRSIKEGKTTRQNIWVAGRNDNGSWSEPMEVTTFNTTKYNAVVGVNDEGTGLYLKNEFLVKKNEGSYISYISKQGDTAWSTPMPVNIPFAENYGSYSDYHITSDENIVVFSMNTNGTKGEEDLYVCLKQIDGSWSLPINLGDVVNSKGFEISPFLMPDKKTLFFSTNGRGDSRGGADIYYTQRLDNSWINWSTPVNLGEKVNTQGFDAYFIVTPFRDVFYSSSKTNDYSALYAGKISGEIMEKATQSAGTGGAPAECKDVCKELDSLKEAMKNIKPTVTTTTVVQERSMQYIYFGYDKDNLDEAARVTLDEVVSMMKGEESYKIMFIGHADSKGANNYNMNLSEKRCMAAQKYLEKKGIPSGRIYYKPYGEEKITPAGPKDDEYYNRKVELVFMKAPTSSSK
jgi:outer membrane protein OmpA-like peptidoglycan-associated protein